MEIQTKYMGTIEVEQIIHFPQGLPAFETSSSLFSITMKTASSFTCSLSECSCAL